MIENSSKRVITSAVRPKQPVRLSTDTGRRSRPTAFSESARLKSASFSPVSSIAIALELAPEVRQSNGSVLDLWAQAAGACRRSRNAR